MRPRNYLNNKDLLLEIHKSKSSFSSFVDPEYHQFDIILNSLDQINDDIIEEAKQNRADRLQKECHMERLKDNPKAKLGDVLFDAQEITKQELVFRIMTFDHIPLDPGRKKNPKTISDHHVRCNFPPFQHYRFDENEMLKCVGKSHWIGGMDNGYFSKEHGQITPKLARMFIKLCERYGSRSNWRGYTYNDEMQSSALLQLSQIGLQFDESKSQNPFAYYTAAITNSFTRVLNLEKRNQNIRDDILEQNGMNPSYTRQAANESIKRETSTPADK